MYCSECGAKNKKDALFCEECGAKLEPIEEEKIKKKSTPKKKSTKKLTKKQTIIIIVIVAVIVILFTIFIPCGVFCTGRETRTPDPRFWRPMLYQLSYARVLNLQSPEKLRL